MNLIDCTTTSEFPAHLCCCAPCLPIIQLIVLSSVPKGGKFSCSSSLSLSSIMPWLQTNSIFYTWSQESKPDGSISVSLASITADYAASLSSKNFSNYNMRELASVMNFFIWKFFGVEGHSG